MKNSVDQSKEVTAQDQACNEKTCATCFENRGCMYEQYLVGMPANTEGYRPQQVMETASKQISKRA